MKPDDIVNALNDMDYDMIEEAEMEKKILIPKLRGKKTVLIAAAVCLLLCGTAAAAGIFWIKPEVHANADGHTLLINQGYIELPEDAVQTILANRIPERNYNCFLNFETVAEWQEFFDLPFVTSSLLVTEEDGQWVDYTGNGILVPKGDIDTYITSVDEENETKFGIMGSVFSVERIYSAEDDSEQINWHGSIQIHAALSEEAVEDASHSVRVEGVITEETLTEATTPTGIPYVIRRIVSGDSGETVQFFLYYGYESVMYELWVTAHSPEEEKIIADDLQKIAETLQVVYPEK